MNLDVIFWLINNLLVKVNILTTPKTRDYQLNFLSLLRIINLILKTRSIMNPNS